MIRFENVTKVYPGQERPALDSVNLEIVKGEFVFLTGASGAGKSTFLKLIFGAEAPSDGQVLVHGQNLARLARRDRALLRRRVGRVFQDFKLLERGARMPLSMWNPTPGLYTRYGDVHVVVDGDPRDPAVDMGPVIDAAAAEKIRRYIEIGKREARLVCGEFTQSHEATKAPSGSEFPLPHIFVDVAPTAVIALVSAAVVAAPL